MNCDKKYQYLYKLASKLGFETKCIHVINS